MSEASFHAGIFMVKLNFKQRLRVLLNAHTNETINFTQYLVALQKA
jgi:hypothetical protein